MMDLDGLLERLKESVPEQDYEKLEILCRAYLTLTELIEDERMTIRRLREMLYGRSTEKTSKVVGEAKREAADDSSDHRGPTDHGDETDGQVSSPSRDETRKRKRKGHGRHGADAYKSAERIRIPHNEVTPGQRCPECKKGKLYAKKPAVLLRVSGTPPLRAKLYELDRLRCNLCEKIFTANAPDGVGQDKYDATAAAMIGLLKYGSGLPFNRLEGLQGNLGIPLPASTQWDIVRDCSVELELVFEELMRQAAAGDVLYNDDTSMKVLSLLKESSQQEDGIAAGRTGVFTSGLVSTKQGHRIALFFTGRRHAGENLSQVLAQRASELPPPIQMCDALSRNLPKEFEVILANCLAHGRRYFVKVVDDFPDECRYVLKALAEVYRNDARAREQQLSPDERLRLHQEKSEPILKQLKVWFKAQLADKNVEPNSGLGQAIQYMLKHWKKLTRFLRVPGAPIDNNLCERILKKAILHRKNSLFYKTRNGARVGDIYLSLIHTAELNGVDPFHYLTELIRNRLEIKTHPAHWLPWNYRDSLPRTQTSA
jgi:hypothetical protein